MRLRRSGVFDMGRKGDAGSKTKAKSKRPRASASSARKPAANGKGNKRRKPHQFDADGGEAMVADVTDPDEDDLEFVGNLARSNRGHKFLASFGEATFDTIDGDDDEAVGGAAKHDADAIIEKHERKSRKLSGEEGGPGSREVEYRVPLLPVKDEHGILAAPKADADAVERKPVAVAQRGATKPQGDADAGVGERPKHKERKAAKERRPKAETFDDMRRGIAMCSVSALENPEKNGEEGIQALLQYARAKHPDVCRLAMLSLQAIFKDILPSYKLNPITDADANLSKEVRRQHDYEAMLLRTYRHALRIFMRRAKSGSGRDRAVAMQCLCNLLRTHYNFNFRKDVLKCIVPLLASPQTDVASEGLKCLREVFAVDLEGVATLEAVQLIADLIRQRECDMDGAIVELLTHIRLSADLERKLEEAKEDEEAPVSRKEKHRRALERRRKRDAALAEGKDVDFHLSSAVYSVKEKLKIQTKILEGMFECFFRVLKSFRVIAGGDDASGSDSESESDLGGMNWSLLSSTLRCLVKYLGFINVDFMGDLFNSLYGIANAKSVPTACRFECLCAVYEILDGPGKVLNIDVLRFDAILFDILLVDVLGEDTTALPKGSAQGKSGDEACAKALQIALLTRRVMDRKRIINFVKRLSGCGMHKPCCEHALSHMNLVGRMLQKYVSSRQLLENDEFCGVYGYGDFAKTMDLNAKNTCPLWETCLLRSHFHPRVAETATAIARAGFLKGTSTVLNTIDVGRVFEEYASARGRFNPAPKPPKKTPARDKKRKA